MRLIRQGVLAFVTIAIVGSVALVHPSPTAAAGCIKFVSSRFDAPGNDNDNENGEWVRIKNVCASRHSIGGWRIHDYGKDHTYAFPDSYWIGAGVAVTLYTGRGLSTHWKRYWGQRNAVWNNTPPEWAFLRKPDGTLMSRWTEY